MRKLLVVVDMQNDFVNGVLGTKEAQNIVNGIADYAKNFDGDIVFTRDTHKDNYMDTQEGKKLPVKHCVKGTDGWQIVPELDTTNRTIFDKPAFGSIALGGWLASLQKPYDEIYFCGVCTGICVLSNVAIVKAYCPETEVKVIESLCACVTPDTHKTAIDAMRTFQVDII